MKLIILNQTILLLAKAGKHGQETGDRRQETGDRRQELGEFRGGRSKNFKNDFSAQLCMHLKY
ncbi:MAG: hypothetical protein F6K13_01080 [Okeania sp. SIO2B9]|uniref:hypothetical protein n=1 Tax=Okeania hirsuta TaxID=1458930 RepID=UPI00142CFEB8|nr:hypothetical protein [Okeania hirsuta]NES87907.1 hypothetical protein [Okeania sp. SIO2B9]